MGYNDINWSIGSDWNWSGNSKNDDIITYMWPVAEERKYRTEGRSRIMGPEISQHSGKYFLFTVHIK